MRFRATRTQAFHSARCPVKQFPGAVSTRGRQRRGLVGSAGVLEQGKGIGWIAREPVMSARANGCSTPERGTQADQTPRPAERPPREHRFECDRESRAPLRGVILLQFALEYAITTNQLTAGRAESARVVTQEQSRSIVVGPCNSVQLKGGSVEKDLQRCEEWPETHGRTKPRAPILQPARERNIFIPVKAVKATQVIIFNSFTHNTYILRAFTAFTCNLWPANSAHALDWALRRRANVASRRRNGLFRSLKP